MKTPNEYADIAVTNFEKGMNCSQAVICAIAKDYGLDTSLIAKITSSFGGGMAHLGEVCGAVSGAFGAYGLIRGYDENDVEESGNQVGKLKSHHYKNLQKISKKFVELHKSYICRELLRNGENTGRKNCKLFVKDATIIVAELLQEEN